MPARLTRILHVLLIWGLFAVAGEGNGQTQRQQRQISAATPDTGLPVRPAKSVQKETPGKEEAEKIRLRAMQLAEKKEYRDALRSLYQLLNHYEKENLQPEQVRLLQDIGNIYESWKIPERALEYYSRAISKIKSHGVEAGSLFGILVKSAECQLALGRPDAAARLLKEALTREDGSGSRTSRRHALLLLSESLMQEKKYSEGLSISLEIVQMEEARGTGPGLALALNNAGFLYKTLRQPDKAREMLNRAIAVESALPLRDNKSIVSMRVNLASISNGQGQFREALDELLAALKLATEINDAGLQSEIRNYLALIYFNYRDYPNAYFHSRESVRLAAKSGNPEKTVNACRTYSMILEKTGDYREAYRYAERSFRLKDSLRLAEQQQLREQMANRQAAERTEKEIKVLLTDAEKSEFELQKISLQAERRQQDLELMARRQELSEISYRARQLENERALQESQHESQKLASEKRIQQMALEQFETALSAQKLEKKDRENHILLLEKEKKIQENNLRIQQDRLLAQTAREKYFKSIGVLIALIVAGLGYGYFQIRQKNTALRASQAQTELANRNLAELNREISVKSKNITDSLHYARGIQEAILPERQKWDATFPDSFIFFRPKDIVSGDFYFLARHNNLTFLAFADCTGHGVPGAIVSVMGHNLLSSCIEVRGMTEPGLILNEIHEGIRKTLQPEVNENRDAIEMGLCVFDPDRDLFRFASAMRPLYGIRNGNWLEWKGERTSLGADPGPSGPFPVFECPISELDSLYLTSDGYADQLGRGTEKRFLTRRLRTLLAGMGSLPMTEQGRKIAAAMDGWMEGERQLDDMMVIGIRPGKAQFRS